MVMFKDDRSGAGLDPNEVLMDIRTLLYVIALQGRDGADLFSSRPLENFIATRVAPENTSEKREDV